jgi:hypothetical protein
MKTMEWIRTEDQTESLENLIEVLKNIEEDTIVIEKTNGLPMSTLIAKVDNNDNDYPNGSITLIDGSPFTPVYYVKFTKGATNKEYLRSFLRQIAVRWLQVSHVHPFVFERSASLLVSKEDLRDRDCTFLIVPEFTYEYWYVKNQYLDGNMVVYRGGDTRVLFEPDVRGWDKKYTSEGE